MRPDHRLGVALRRILDGLLAARLPAIFASIALRLAWIVLIVIPVGSLVLVARYAVEVTLTAQAITQGRPMIKRERGPTID